MSFIVAGLGEILWDVFADKETLGGAPVNFAFHAQSLGARAYPVSTIGDDERGKRALAELSAHGMDLSTVSVDPGRPTGYVQATVDEAGVASYYFPDDVAWDYLHINDAAQDLARELDAVCFGTLAQRSSVSRAAIQSYLGMLMPDVVKVLDVNLRQGFYSRELIQASLELANVLKISDEELPVLAKMFDFRGDHCDVLRAFIARFNLQLTALTRGPHGSLLVTPNEISEHPGEPTEVVDTVGAGDCFTATVVMGMLQGLGVGEMNVRANKAAAYVCAHKGAMVSTLFLG